MDSIDSVRFTRDVFTLLNIILLARSVFVYNLDFTELLSPQSDVSISQNICLLTRQGITYEALFRLTALLLAGGIGWTYIPFSPAARDCFIHRNLYGAPRHDTHLQVTLVTCRAAVRHHTCHGGNNTNGLNYHLSRQKTFNSYAEGSR